MKVALITALFAFLSLSIAQAQLPSTLIARDEQVGNLRLTVNGEVVIGMEKGACKVKVNSEKLELSSISQYDFNVYFADYSLESHTEGRGDFLNVYSINSIDLNSKAAQEACVNDKVASYTQVL